MANSAAKFLLVLAMASIVSGQLTPNANDQCKISYNIETASFCQSYTANICSSLTCRLTPSGPCITTAAFGAADGTPCGNGFVCSSGQCVSGQSNLPDDCLFGDGILVNQTQIPDPLPQTTMSCNDYMVYLVANGNSPFLYCSNSTFRSVCCQTCKLYDTFKCRDLNPSDCVDIDDYCNSTSVQIKGLPVNIVCPYTCGCCNQQLKCDSCMCQNGATCVNVAATSNLLIGFYCQCPVGYYGQFCELKSPCNPNPCQNGGTCSSPGPLLYACACAAGYAGSNCETTSLTGGGGNSNICYPNPCANGGVCIPNGNGGFHCECPSIYTGNYCTQTPCSQNPCQNGGTCQINNQVYPYYQCQCPSNCGGTNCQIRR